MRTGQTEDGVELHVPDNTRQTPSHDRKKTMKTNQTSAKRTSERIHHSTRSVINMLRGLDYV